MRVFYPFLVDLFLPSAMKKIIKTLSLYVVGVVILFVENLLHSIQAQTCLLLDVAVEQISIYSRFVIFIQLFILIDSI